MARKKCELESCNRVFEPKSTVQKYCSGAHRTAACRLGRGKAGQVVQLPGTKPKLGVGSSETGAPGTLAETVRRELEKAKRLDTALGVHVLKLAERIDRAALTETGAGYAALDKAFRAAYAEALADAEEAGDELDELRDQAQRLRAL